MRFQLIYNPTAGRGRARRHIAEAQAHLRARGVEVECRESTSPADLTRLAAEASGAGYDRVVVCGGDGSLNLAVREFNLQQGTLGLIPLGSGDDFARVLGIPRDVKRACDVLVDGSLREVDVATANGLRYLGVAGLGFDSEVARYANERVKLLRGSLVYLYAILRVLPRFKPHRVQLNGREETIMFACVGNSRQYGGGIRITPAALVDDRELDLCIVHRTSRAQLLKTLPRAYTGSHVKSAFVETGRGTDFHFTAETPLDVYADGEWLTQTPVRFALAAERLRIAVP
jgi:diacylglycerol kinase (ATP)